MTTIKKTFKGMSVDAGLLCVADYGYLEENGAVWDKYEDGRDDIRQIIEVPPGKYNVKYSVDAWIDNKGGEVINCKSGKLVVGDPCYNFDKEWSNFLKLTDYCKTNDYFVEIATGGDGGFDLELEISEVLL